MPQVMNDITNLCGGVESHCEKQKVTHTGLGGKENQEPPSLTGKGAFRPVKATKPREAQIWDMIYNVTHDLVRCWAMNRGDGAGEVTPWMHNSVAKFGNFGPRVQQALLHGPPDLPPPPPPPVGIWAVEMHFPSENWTDDGPNKEIKDLTSDTLLLGPCHEQMEQLRPNAEDIDECLTPEERQNSLLWISQVCTLHNLDDCVFQECVMLFDRYVAASQDRTLLDDDQCKYVAIFNIARKVAGAAAGNNYCPGSLAKRLGPEKFSQILAAELHILKVLDYQTVGHSALDFLESLVFSLERHGRQELRNAESPLKCVAKFLLQLALGNATLLYRYPYAILAAGAVYVALWCTQASPERFLVLMQDVVAAMTPTDLLDDEIGGELGIYGGAGEHWM